MAVKKSNDHMVDDYKISEGNAIGYLPAEFDGSVAGNKLREVSLKAKVDISKGQLVKVSGSYEVDVASASTDTVLGVAMFDTKAGEPISVETEGLFKLEAGAKITTATEARVVASDGGTVSPMGADDTSYVGIAIGDADKGNKVFVKFTI